MANGTLKVSNIETSSGSGTITVGASGETVDLSNGTITLNNSMKMTPAFQAYSSNGQTPSDASWTKVELDAVLFDTDSAFNTSTYRFTVPSGKGGKYFINGLIAIDSQENSGINYSSVKFYKNGGSSELADSYNNWQSNPPRDFAQSLSGIFELAAGDYVELYGYLDDNSGSGMDFKGATGTRIATQMGGYKIIE
jgi:hypothetical protein